MNKTVIVFDIDGVILESLQAKNKAFELLYKNYGTQIVKKVLRHHQENAGMSRFEKIKHYNTNYLNLSNEGSMNKIFLDQFSKLTLNTVSKSNFVDGFMDFLNNLENKFDLYISTGTPTEEAKIILKNKKILHRFIQVFGSPESKKTHLENVVSFYKKLDSKKFYFFGDSVIDYEAAKNFNFKFILRCHNENQKLKDFENILLNFENYYNSSLLKLFYYSKND